MKKENLFRPSFKHSISTVFVKQFEAVLQSKGFDITKMIKAVGISDAVLKHLDSRITPHQFSAFVRGMVYLTNDEFLTCGAGPVPSGHFKEMARQALNFPNIHSVYLHMCNYFNATLDWLKVSFHIHDQYAEIQFHWLKHNSEKEKRLLKEVMTISWHRFPSWLAGENVAMKKVCMDYAKPTHSKEYLLMYPCEVTFENKSLSLRIDKSFLELPIVQTDKTLISYLKTMPLNWFSKQSFLPDINKKVINAIEISNEPGAISIEDVASQLHMCSRTLRRKLDANDTSFQAIKDEIRRDISIEMLLDKKALAEIAHYTNFSDVSAFSRAFKKWTGISPSAYLK